MHENGSADEKTAEPDSKLHYSLTQIPPVPVLISASLQHILMNLAYCVVAGNIVADVLCVEYDDPIRTKLFSSTLLMCGICTLLQTGLGIRLPIFQGPSASFFPALLALQNYAVWVCPSEINPFMGNRTKSNNSPNTTSAIRNESTTVSVLLTQEEKLKQLSGSLMAASALEIFIGSTGLVGFLLRFIGPLTVAPTLVLIGTAIYKIPIQQGRPSWEIAIGGIVLVLIFSLYIEHIKIPLPACTLGKKKKRKRSYFRLFQLFPLLLSILLMWALSFVLTITDVFPNDPSVLRYRARTDAKAALVYRTPWFVFPYPGQFGMPSFSAAVFVGFLAAFCASMIESVGDYFAAANSCEVDPPPDHAVNRGILMEGFGGLLGGAIGVGHATTSYSSNISILAVSKTASRSVMICSGCILILFAILGKIGAAFATIPDPILSGIVAFTCGMLVSIGISTLRHVKLTSSRNLTIIGISLFVGIYIPEWVDRHADFINTGVLELDGVLKVALGTPMFVGGLLALIMDNTVKGTRKERGISVWRQTKMRTPSYISDSQAYEWQCLGRIYQRFKFLSRLPFMPLKMEPSEDKTSNCAENLPEMDIEGL